MGITTAALQMVVNAAWPVLSGDLARAAGRSIAAPRAATGSLSNPSPGWLEAFGVPSDAGVTVSPETAQQVTTVYRCVHLLSSTIASLPWQVMETNRDGTTVPVLDHPVQQVLTTPNPATSRFNFRELMLESYHRRGNGVAAIVRARSYRPTELIWIPAQNIIRVYADGGRIKYQVSYTDTVGGRAVQQAEVLDQDEVLHFLGPFSNGMWAPSPISTARNAIGLARAGTMYQSKYLSTGGRPSAAIEVPPETTPESLEKFKTEWKGYYEGLSNAGRTAFMPGGAKLVPVSFSQQDAELLLTQRFQVEEISRIWGVPLFLLNDTEKSTSWGTGLVEQATSFVRYSLAPQAQRFQAEMDRKLFRGDEAGRFGVQIVMEGLLRGSFNERAKYWETMVQKAAVVTPNEARRGENLPPVEGGDELRQPTGAPPQDTDGDDDRDQQVA